MTTTRLNRGATESPNTTISVPSRQSKKRWIPTISLGTILGYLILVPIVFVIISSFKPTGFIFDPGFTLQHYVELYGDAGIFTLFIRTSIFAIGATLGAVVIGTLLAWLVERTDVPARGLLRALIVLPMATPPVLLAIAWVTMLDPEIGFINTGLQNILGLASAPIDIYSIEGMIFVEAIILVPTAFLVLSPAFRNMDPNLEDAAYASGENLVTTFWRVILPLVMPSVLAVSIFLLITSFVVFEVPGIIGVPGNEYVFSSAVVDFARNSPTGLPEYGRISALTVFFLLLLLALTTVYGKLTKKTEKFVTVSGKGFRAKRFALRKWRIPAALAVWGYFLMAVLGPFMMLLWTSLLPYRAAVSADAVSMLSLDNYVAIAGNESVRSASLNTLIIALVSATAVSVLSIAVSWTVIRTKAPGRKLIDGLSFVPVALAGVMMGTALIYVYLSIDVLPIYGSIWIIAIAHTTAYLAYGTKLTNGVLLQMSPELEEAGAASGASGFTAFRRITLPIMMPALIGLWIWVAAHSIRELSSALMVAGRENQVVSTLLWGFWEGGQPTTASAIGVVMMLTLVVLVGFWQIMVSRKEARSSSEGK